MEPAPRSTVARGSSGSTGPLTVTLNCAETEAASCTHQGGLKHRGEVAAGLLSEDNEDEWGCLARS